MLTAEQEIATAIHEELHSILQQKSVEPGPLSPARELTELGLGSLDLAQLVAVLEARLEVDPFRELVPITSVRTLEDLRRAYERAVAGEAPSDDPSEELMKARARVQARQGS